ncbi:hypothetical protein OH687_35630 [Burkholderia anthina]|nr:hypothetical protein OH687_35630 [Burkholderia anthina]
MSGDILRPVPANDAGGCAPARAGRTAGGKRRTTAATNGEGKRKGKGKTSIRCGGEAGDARSGRTPDERRQAGGISPSGPPARTGRRRMARRRGGLQP